MRQIYRTDFDFSDTQNVDVVLGLISDNYIFYAKLLNPSISTLHDKNVLEARKKCYTLHSLKGSQELAKDYQKL